MTLRDHLVDLSRVVNISIAKRISFAIVIVLLISNTLTYLDYGFDPCRGILINGRLLDKEDGIWQPHGCMLHHYKTSESLSCLENRKIIFAGDSRMRELMFEFIHSVDEKYEVPEGKIHSDVLFNEDNLMLKFLWIPEINDTAFQFYDKLDAEDNSPIIFQSGGPHTIKRFNGSVDGLNEFSTNLTKLSVKMEKLADGHRTKLFWISEEPVYESKLYETRKAITNERLEEYNQAARIALEKLVSKGKIKIIESFAQLSLGLVDYSKDGLHLSKQALKAEANILLNYLCNNRIRPIDGTCCQSSPSLSVGQIFTAVAGLFTFVAASVLFHLKHKKNRSKTGDVENPESANSNGAVVQELDKLIPQDKEASQKQAVDKKYEVLYDVVPALAKYSLIMMYFFMCDRTNIFMKGNKHFTNARFFLPLLYVSLLGLFGISSTSQTAFLNRDQTDEWKGWMQLIILIYHMSGASVNVPIYMHIRILVAMYLFMTGYGHFSYFWHKGDYGVYRVLNVLVRLNFLTVSLCIVMNRSYQFYYFVPLCTFWFLVLYIAMAMWPRANAKMLNTNDAANGSDKKFVVRGVNLSSPYIVMILKLVALLVAISALYVSERYYEAIFSWWPAIRLFELPEGSVREWWFRCQLDRYAMIHGAVICFIYIILKKLSVLDDSKQGCLLSIKTSFITLTLSIGVIIFYVVWAAQCTDKVACNRIHSYASVFPVTAFIIIRNVPGYLRSGYSAFFAWFGKISLELFIGQYHIWLAADTKGMLVVISPEWPTLNLVITSFVFVAVAHEINVVTGIVTKHILGPPSGDKGKMLIRLMCVLTTICAISLVENLLFV